ncbi:hypothetical protein V8F20_004257 [Naviculisporaceae sp. PSN 640]
MEASVAVFDSPLVDHSLQEETELDDSDDERTEGMKDVGGGGDSRPEKAESGLLRNEREGHEHAAAVRMAGTTPGLTWTRRRHWDADPWVRSTGYLYDQTSGLTGSLEVKGRVKGVILMKDPEQSGWSKMTIVTDAHGRRCRSSRWDEQHLTDSHGDKTEQRKEFGFGSHPCQGLAHGRIGRAGSRVGFGSELLYVGDRRACRRTGHIRNIECRTPNWRDQGGV